MFPPRAVAVLLSIVGLTISVDAVGQAAPGTHRIGFVNVGPAGPNSPNVAAFRAGLAERGYVEGRNLIIDFRWGDQDASRLPALINELLALKPEVLISGGGPVTLRAVKNIVTTVPVVFVTGDPVVEGIVPNFARPGGNLTGFAVLAGDLEPKRLEILRQMLPQAKRIAVVWNPAGPSAEANFRGADAAAGRLGMTVLSWQARNRAELERAFAEIAVARADALFVIGDPVLGFERERIVAFANQHRLPGLYFWREFPAIGGLASYGTSLTSLYRRAATYVDQILKGTKPGDIPVQQPTTFEFVINLGTAKALGITIPLAVRQRADEVIE